jgi:hypothetical protein
LRGERVFLLRIEALDWNCPQSITPRFTKEEIHEHRRRGSRSSSQGSDLLIVDEVGYDP